MISPCFLRENLKSILWCCASERPSGQVFRNWVLYLFGDDFLSIFKKKFYFFNVTYLGNSMLFTANLGIKSIVFENEIPDLLNFFWIFLRGKKNCKVLFVSKLNKSYLWNIFIFDIFQYIFEYSPLLIDLFLANSFLLTYLCTVFYSFYPQTFPVNRYLFLRSKLLHARTDDFSICNFLLHLGFF